MAVADNQGAADNFSCAGASSAGSDWLGLTPRSYKAMGAGRRRIMTIFLLQGGLVGLVGSGLGSALAYALLVVFSHVFKSPDGSPMFAAELDPMLVLMATGLACLVGLAAAAVPARSAARMDPVQAIRA